MSLPCILLSETMKVKDGSARLQAPPRVVVDIQSTIDPLWDIVEGQCEGKSVQQVEWQAVLPLFNLL